MDTLFQKKINCVKVIYQNDSPASHLHRLAWGKRKFLIRYAVPQLRGGQKRDMKHMVSSGSYPTSHQKRTQTLIPNTVGFESSSFTF